jgi:hypothetical protein
MYKKEGRLIEINDVATHRIFHDGVYFNAHNNHDNKWFTFWTCCHEYGKTGWGCKANLLIPKESVKGKRLGILRFEHKHSWVRKFNILINYLLILVCQCRLQRNNSSAVDF